MKHCVFHIESSVCIAFPYTDTQAKFIVPSHGQWDRFWYGKHEAQERWERKKMNEYEQQCLRLWKISVYVMWTCCCHRFRVLEFCLSLKHLPNWVSVCIMWIDRRRRRRTHYPNKSKLPSMTKCDKNLNELQQQQKSHLSCMCVCVHVCEWHTQTKRERETDHWTINMEISKIQWMWLCTNDVYIYWLYAIGSVFR